MIRYPIINTSDIELIGLKFNTGTKKKKNRIINQGKNVYLSISLYVIITNIFYLFSFN
ncbi:hypothetical protein T190115A13A_10036 [Tenacibaculum sp. 190524A02b]|uniref:Uncharacterized protein n=1 Tax=Tenacibaculum vairaonense TaxID=3137860 RepID=A0ABM9PJQ1_9FLAO